MYSGGFYPYDTQGDYGLFQCSEPFCQETFDNEETIWQMVLAQGYEITADGALTLPEGIMPKRKCWSGFKPSFRTF